jgi:hypothetical protein
MDSASAWQVQVRSQEDWTHYMETPVDEDGDGGAIKAQLTVQQFNFVLPPAPLTVLTVELQCPRWTRHQFTTNVIPDDLQLPLSVGAVGPATIPPHDLPLGNFDYDPSRQQFHPRLPIINEQLFGVNYDPIYDDSTKRNTHLTGHWDPFSTGPIQLSFHQMRPWLHHAHGTHIWLRQIGDPKFKQLLITVYYDQIPHCNHHDSKIMQCTNEVHELHGRPLYDDTPPVHPTKYIRHAEPTALFDQVSVGSFQHHAEGWVLPWLRMPGARRVRGLVYSIRIWASLNMKVAGRLMRPDARYYWQIEDAVKHDGLLTAWSFTAKALAPRRCMTSPFRVLNLPTAPIIEEDGEDESVPLLTGEDQSLIEESNEPL